MTPSPGRIHFNRSQLQHAFKHAKDFGVTGNASRQKLGEFAHAIESHIADSGTVAVSGSYRGLTVTHFVNPATGLNVILDQAENFLTGWKLSQAQRTHVLRTGKLGGGK